MNTEKKNNVAGLLRSPGEFSDQIREETPSARLIGFLVLLTVLGPALFGFALGSFVEIRVALLDATKLAGIVLFAFALTSPTLYVFSCICGSRLNLGRVLALGLVSTATLGCLLAALAPILWLFAVSTASVQFVLLFAVLLAVVVIPFARRPFAGAVQKGIAVSSAGFEIWIAVFVLVALQTITLVRPMLSPLGSPREPDGKCFFVSHFFDSL